MDKKKIGELLTTKREGLGLSSEKIADQIGVNRTTVDRWERGLCKIRYSLVNRIAEVYQLTSEEAKQLFGFAPPSVKQPCADDFIFATIEDLEFLASVAQKLQKPMGLSLIRDLLVHRRHITPQ